MFTSCTGPVRDDGRATNHSTRAFGRGPRTCNDMAASKIDWHPTAYTLRRFHVPPRKKVDVHGSCRHPGPGVRKHAARAVRRRSEEHTSELQSQSNLVCRLLLE